MRWNGLCAAVRVALLGGAWIAHASVATAAPDAAPRGSILERAGSAGSVQVLTREELERSGFVTLGDVLQRLPASGPAQNALYNNGGNGEQRVNLRQLGTQRTLLLVNGRRWITTLDGSADLSSIPWAAIERVEIAYGSDGARYGSGAVAGTINVVLRSEYEGLEARSWYGRYDEGDGTTQQHDFTIGAAGERGHVVLGAEYAEREPILAGDRLISSVPLFGFDGNNVNIGGASSTTPFGRFSVPGIPGTVVLIPGEDGAQPSDFRPYTFATDGFNFAPDNYLLTPQERIGLFARGRYAITDAISFNTTVLYNERRSEQQLAAFPITLGTLFGVPAPISADNVYNPFGRAITSRIQYRPDNRFVRSFNQDVDTFHFSGGLDGTFDLWDRPFAWSVDYSYTDREQRGTTFGQYDLERIRRGLGPSYVDPYTGVATCGELYIPIPDCVPINFLGGPDGFTQAMYDYASVAVQDTAYVKQHSYVANLAGDLFHLPAGPLHFAVGYEHRRESGFDRPDALVATGTTTQFARPATAGGYSLDELYLDFSVPLLKERAFADSLELALAVRRSDYSTFGEATHPTLGFRWKPFQDLLIRGEYAEGFRAPAIGELFVERSDNFPELWDPCAQSAFESGWVDQATRDRCLAGIVDAAGRLLPGVPPYFDQAGQIRTIVGGNPDLRPELGRSRSLGLVYTPSAVEGLNVYLDWYRIELTEAIGEPTAQRVILDCYARADLEACTLVTRGASGDIISLFHGNLNLAGGTEVEGYDFGVSYGFDSSWGRFDVEWQNAYVSYLGDLGQDPFGYCRERGVSLPLFADESCPGALASGNTVGVYQTFLPRWRLKSNLSTTWQRGDWGATLAMRYVSALDEDCSLPVDRNRQELCTNPDGSPQFPFGENRIDETWYFDLQGTWDTPWNGRVTAGVRNLLDEDPPLAFDAFANSFDPQYEVPGRFFYVAYAQRF